MSIAFSNPYLYLGAFIALIALLTILRGICGYLSHLGYAWAQAVAESIDKTLNALLRQQPMQHARTLRASNPPSEPYL